MEEIIALIKHGNNEALEKIANENPSMLNVRTAQGISLLMFACYCRNSHAVSILKRHTSLLTIFEASGTGDINAVERELEKDPGLINSFSEDGFTPLGLASFFENAPIVRYLLEKGADPNLASNNHFHVAPLHSACAVSNYDLVEILIENGANVNAKQMDGFTPLHAAALQGQTKIARLLIEAGADITAKTDNGQSPLSMASEKDFKEVAELIKEYL